MPTSQDDDPKQIAVEIGHLMGVEIEKEHISNAHRLPPTRKVKDRLIVKFVRRNIRDAFYKQRSKLVGKSRMICRRLIVNMKIRIINLIASL